MVGLLEVHRVGRPVEARVQFVDPRQGVKDAQVTVLDPAPQELNVAEDMGYEVVEGLMEDFEPGGRKWDMVLMCQTIDHLLDIRNALYKTRSMLAKGGCFFFDFVDWEHMRQRMGTLAGSVKIDHPYYLERRIALEFSKRSSFKVTAVSM